MYEYATRLNQTGPVVHKRRLLPDGVWERYQPDFSHITEADKEVYRRLAREYRLLRMKMGSQLVH